MNRKQKEQQFWDKFASRYDNFIGKRAKDDYAKLKHWLLEDTPKTKHLLEIGTGTGLLSFMLKDQIDSIVATDISPEMIKVAKGKAKEQNVNKILFQVEDSYQLSFSEEKFDCIIASNVLHLLFEPEKPLAEMKRVLRKGGKVILPTYCHGHNFKSELTSRLMSLFSGFRVNNRWSVDSFRQFLEKNDFQIEKQQVVGKLVPLAYTVVSVRN